MEHIELIEAYFRNELSEEERNSFQVRLESDTEFASEVENYQLITKGIQQMGDESNLKEKMELWHKEDSDLGNRSLFSFTPLKVAAVLVPILLISGLIYYYLPTPTTDQDLFVAYFKPYEDIVTNRSSPEGTFGEAMSYYNTAAYEEAIELFRKALIDENDTEKVIIAQFYQAMAYLASGQTKEAESLLQQVVQTDNPLFQEVSQWYLLLVYIKTDQTAAARDQMKLILNDPDHVYTQQVKQLNEEWKVR